MNRIPLVAALTLLASVANAQDTTIVVVRHIPAVQDTTVVVRHLSMPPAPRYMAGAVGVLPKDPALGTTLSFLIPGGGQYYAGATGKGLALTLLGYGAPIIGFASVKRENSYYNNGYGPSSGYNCPGFGNGPGCGASRYDWTPAVVGLGVGLAAWIYGIETAGSDVNHWNKAHGVRFMAAPGRVGIAVPWP
jgi:hypothetical protein